MIQSSDNFQPSFSGCPTPLRELLEEAIALSKQTVPRKRVLSSVKFFTMGIQLYGLSRWMCNDYIPVYGFSGDCFKLAADVLLTAEVDFLSDRNNCRLALYWYGRAGHCYRASNDLAASTYCFFTAYELALQQKDIVLTKYYAAEGWKTVTDRWLLLPHDLGLEDALEIDDFILRLDGYDFQWLVWFVLHKKQFEVEVGKRTRDGGIDLVGFYEDTAWSTKKQLIVQCKNPQNKKKKVGVSTVREMLGVCHLQTQRPDELMLVTTTDFTSEAKQAATDSPVPIILVNKTKLFELLKEVYEPEVFSEDAQTRSDERAILLGIGMREEFLNRLYERQEQVSVFPYFMNID